MKLVFMLMVFCNIAFFSWQFFNSETSAKTSNRNVNTSFKKSGQIILLHERQNKRNRKKSRPSKRQRRSDASDSINYFSQTVVVRADPDKNKDEEKLQLAKCYALGPFNVGPNVERAISKLKEYGIAGNKRKEEIRERLRHWVLEPTKNKKAALRRVRELRNKNIKDVYIIRKGDKKNKISLGFFRNSVAAKKRVKELKRLGFRPIVEKSYRIRAIYWLDVAIAEDVEFTEKQWEAVTDGFDGILKKEQPCP